MKKGKLIVIEGSDGAGKGTQLTYLTDYLKKKRISYSTLDFPQYYKTIFGAWIGRFLKGDFGTVEEINPYLLMFPYAADRWQAKADLEKWLSEGKLVISNRYTGSNAYQAAKLPRLEQNRFTEWSFKMEYEGFGIPREDLVIFLYVPVEVSQKLIGTKKNRKYLGNGTKKDLHESNRKLLEEVERVYLGYCRKYHHWVKIDCTKNGQMLSKEEVHQKVIQVLIKNKIFPKS
jgi:dTMP kinase